MWELYWDSFADNLKVDQALLNVSSSLKTNAWLYQLSDECIACPYKRIGKIAAHSFIEKKITTETQLKWSIFNNNIGPYTLNNSTPFCIVEPENLGQFGVYNLTINSTGCQFNTHILPVNTSLSIFWLICVVVFLYILFKLAQIFYKKIFVATTTDSSNQLNTDATETLNQPNENINKIPTSNRLSSLDAFRGLAIVSMIFANSGCGKYYWIEHAPWNGIHPADFIFPSFLWIMGVCIPISLKSQFARNIPRTFMLKNILIRSVKLFMIGLCIHTAYGPDLKDVRIMGVLQRFGIAYLIVASLQVLLTKPSSRTQNLPNDEQSFWRKQFIDIISLSSQWLIMIGIVIVHLLIIFGLPVPNCPRGYLGPGGLHEMRKYNNCIGGATGYIDRILIGQNHLYQRPRSSRVYDETMPFDPEGPFGCLLTIVHVFFGVQCGTTLLMYSKPIDRIKRWSIWGLVSTIVGCILCKFSINDGIIPINKNLWSLSFVLVTTGFAFFLLTLFYVIIDVKKYWTGMPLTFAGMNAILMYIGSELLGQMYPFYWHFTGMNTHLMFLLANAWNATLWLYIAYCLYEREIFLSL